MIQMEHKGRSNWRRIDLWVSQLAGAGRRVSRPTRCQNAQSLKLAFIVSAFVAYGSIAKWGG